MYSSLTPISKVMATITMKSLHISAISKFSEIIAFTFINEILWDFWTILEKSGLTTSQNFLLLEISFVSRLLKYALFCFLDNFVQKLRDNLEAFLFSIEVDSSTSLPPCS